MQSLNEIALAGGIKEMGLAEFRLIVRQTQDDAPVGVTLLAPEEIRALPQVEAKERLNPLLHQVRVRPEFTIYGFGTYSSYVERPAEEGLYGHNTLVEVNLPYTLHLPTGMLFPLTVPEPNVRGIVQTRKIWTGLASGSNSVEAYADDQLLYYGPAHPISPTVPQDPALGPWPHFTGTNVEVGKDTHGVLRYTQVRILFDTPHPNIDGADDSESTQQARKAAVENASAIAGKAVNYLLDVYRSVTGEHHPERLAKMLVTRVYFADVNVVFESVGVESGVGSAIINRSRREIDQIAAMLVAGSQPTPHTLLLQSAHSALERGQLLLAVVVAFQAQEMVIEAGIRAGLRRQGVGDVEITERLKGCLSTKERLTTLSRGALGGRSISDDGVFWNAWLQECNRKRNDIVHRGLALTEAQAKRVVQLCEDCITRFMAIY
jgi:hypothetical protein